MPSNQTPNYGLSQWARSDQVRMEDFNADNGKIDAALKAESDARIAADAAEAQARTALAAQVALRGNCQIYPFSYTGTGGEQTLNFPRKPLLVVIADGGGVAVCVYGTSSARLLGTGGTSALLHWGETSLSWNDYEINRKGATYLALAFFSME